MTASFEMSIVAGATLGVATYLWVEWLMTRGLLRWCKARALGTATAG